MNQKLSAAIRAAVSGHSEGPARNEGQSNMINLRKNERPDTSAMTDDRAIEIVAQAGFPADEANEIWADRFGASPKLQREFVGDVRLYQSYMNSLLPKARLRAAQMQPSSPLPCLTADENAAVADARARGLNNAEMTALWHARWASSQRLRAEFPTKECYAALMNACARGVVRFHTGKTAR